MIVASYLGIEAQGSCQSHGAWRARRDPFDQQGRNDVGSEEGCRWAAGQRVFASRLKPDHARRFVIFGCVLFSVIGVSSFAATGMVPIMPLVFIAGTLVHFWPALNGSAPALRLDSTGITIDGLGTLVWEAVSGARIRHISRGPVKAQFLEIDTVLPAITMMAESSRPTGLRRFQTRIGRLIGQPT